MQQVYWNEDGWLHLTAGGSTPQLEVPAPLGSIIKVKEEITIFEDIFDGARLKREWNTLRMLAEDSWCSLHERPGFLRIRAGESVQSLFRHHLLAIRQTDKRFRAETALEYEPTSYLQMSGLMLYLNEDNYLYAYISHEEGQGKVLRMMRCAADEFTALPVVIPIEVDVLVRLAVDVDGTSAQFYYCTREEEKWHMLQETQNISFLCGGFTGNFVGIAAHDMNQYRGSHADFSYFRYEGTE